MTTTAGPLDAIDHDLRIAWHELGLARQQQAHSPNAATTRVATRAEAHMNRLLEHRHRLQHR